MRKLAIAAALFLGLLTTPAFARDGAWYVGGDFGAMIVEDTDVFFVLSRKPSVPEFIMTEKFFYKVEPDGTIQYLMTREAYLKTTRGQ